MQGMLFLHRSLPLKADQGFKEIEQERIQLCFDGLRQMHWLRLVLPDVP